MTAAAWAWLGWMTFSLVAFMAAAEWLYDDHIDPPEDDE